VIRAVIFDLGNVVIPFDFRRGYRAIERHCSYPAAEIPKRIRATGLVPRYETGQIESRDFVEELTRALELRLSFEEFCEMWTAIFLPGTLVPESLLDRLRERYRLIALSNTNELHFDVVRANYPVIRKFDELVLSYRVGCVKPDPRIYAEAVARAGCVPAECLFIDDVEAYVDGGRAAGLNAVRFESVEQLERDLARFGVT
jgi:glucose-1-phosphatase